MPFKQLKSAIEKYSKTSWKLLKELVNNDNQKWQCEICEDYGYYHSIYHLNTIW